MMISPKAEFQESPLLEVNLRVFIRATRDDVAYSPC